MDMLNSCRCCLQAAPDLDLTTPYTHLGRTEIYADLLRDCFDLQLTQTGDGPCGVCFTCVGRLRDASTFKLQVQRCQEQLQALMQEPRHVEYENVTIKIERENDGSEEEAVSHEEPVTMKSETVHENVAAENVCKDTLVKSEFSVGVQTWNEAAESSESDENLTIKIERQNDGSEEEAVLHEDPVIMKSETIHENVAAENVCQDTLVKSEFSDGVQTWNQDAKSSESVPLDNAIEDETELKLAPTSHDELNCSGHMIDDDASEGSTDDQSSDISEEQDVGQQRHPCALCHKDFVNKSALKRHQRVIHATEEMYVCEYCNKKFTTKEYLDKHKNTHKGEEPFSCDVCDKVFKKKGYLNLHKATHIGKLYKCDKCNKSFARKWFLQQHQINYCKKKYVCDICNKEFAKKMVLNRHISVHSTILPYECSGCDKRFSRKDSLNAHEKIHSTEKAYSCEECEKQFSNKRNLLRHKMTHSGQKYECTVCNKLFIREDSLKGHQRIHTGEKPVKKIEYTCKDCNKQFLSKTDLSRHARIHTGEKPFACEACHKKFRLKTHLATHLKSCSKHLGI